MGDCITEENLKNSITFSRVANDIYSSGKTFQGSIWTQELTKNAFRDFVKSFFSSKEKHKEEFYLQYIKTKFGAKKDASHTYTLSFVCSLKFHNKDLNEIGLIDRLLNDSEVTKDMIKDLEKVKNWLYKMRKVSFPRQTNLDDFWINVEEIMNMCNDVFPECANYSMAIITNMRNESERIKELRKTDRVEARKQMDCIRVNEINMVYLQHKLLEIFIVDIRQKKDILLKRNDELCETREKLSKLHGKSMLEEGDDMYVEDSNQFLAKKAEHELKIKQAMQNNLDNIQEQKRAYVREISNMHRFMGQSRNSIGKATGLIKCIDEYNESIMKCVEELREKFKQQSKRVIGKDSQIMFQKIGLKGWRFFESGTEVEGNLYETWINKIRHRNWGYDKLYNQIKEKSNNFSNDLKHRMAAEAIQIHYDTTQFTRQVKIGEDQNIGYAKNFDIMQADMRSHNNSDYQGQGDRDSSVDLSDIEDSRNIDMDSDKFSYITNPDQKDDDEEGLHATIYSENAWNKFNQMLPIMKSVWEKDKQKDKPLVKKQLHVETGPSFPDRSQHSPLSVVVSPLKSDFSPTSPLRKSKMEQRDIVDDDLALIRKEMMDENELGASNVYSPRLKHSKQNSPGKSPLKKSGKYSHGVKEKDSEQPKDVKFDDNPTINEFDNQIKLPIDGPKPGDQVPEGAQAPEVKPEGETPVEPKPEGEAPVEPKPEGEAPAEPKPEGEAPAEGEPKPEGEAPVEGEPKPEGEAPAEGEPNPEGEAPAEEAQPPVEITPEEQAAKDEAKKQEEAEKEEARKQEEQAIKEAEEKLADEEAAKFLEGDPEEHEAEKNDPEAADEEETFSEDELPDVSDWEEWGDFTKKNIRWSGFEKHDDEEDKFMIVWNKMQISFDRVISGNDEDEWGQFSVTGEIATDSTLKISKVYAETFKIVYTGVMEGCVFKGTLEVMNDLSEEDSMDLPKNGTKGTWEISPDRSDWIGKVHNDHGESPFTIAFHVEEDGIFGIGKDAQGNYIIRGDYTRTNRAIRFAKVYVKDDSSIQYTASADEIGNEFLTKGVWQSHGDDENNEIDFGEFELMGEPWPGPRIDKKDWWSWGLSTRKQVIWDGWFKSPVDGKQYWREFTNLQFTFDDFDVVGYGEDYYGKYNINGTSVMRDDKWKLDFKQEYEAGHHQDLEDPFIKFNVALDDVTMTGFCGSSVDNTVDTEMKMWVAPCAFTYAVIDDEERNHMPHDKDTPWVVSTMNIGFSTKGVFGIGKDPEFGPYIIRGDLFPKDMSCKFAKQYVGGDKNRCTIYVGRINIHENDIIVKGNWENAKDQQSGLFKVQGKFGDNKETEIQSIPLVPFIPIDDRGNDTNSPGNQGGQEPDKNLDLEKKMTKVEEDPDIDKPAEEPKPEEPNPEEPKPEEDLEWMKWGGLLDTKKVKWSGWFENSGTQTEMVIDTMFIDFDMKIHGSGSDTVGSFTITGTWGDDGAVNFVKQYEGAHAVNYTGKFSSETQITGTWDIPDESNGNFELNVDLETWEGTFNDGDTPYAMQLMISLNRDGIWGKGSDGVGNFLVKGDWIDDVIRFAKKYVGQHVVLYTGAVNADGGDSSGISIVGKWNITVNERSGTFEIHNAIKKTEGDA